MSLNDELPFGRLSARFYVATHMPEFARLLTPRVRKEDMIDVVEALVQNPKYLAALLQNNFSKMMYQRYDDILDRITNESLLIIMMGSRGAGKTATAFKIIEDLLNKGTKKDIYWYGFSRPIKDAYPEVRQTANLRKIENGILLFDEAAIFQGSRDSMTRERIDANKQIPIMRHKDVTTLYLTQVDSIDIDLWRFCDWVWFKPYPGVNFAESKIKMDYIHTFMIPLKKWQNYIFDMQNGIPYFFDTRLPKRWNDDISKPYSIIHDPIDAINFWLDLKQSDLSEREIKTMMALRGWKEEELMEVMQGKQQKQKLPEIPKDVKIRACYRCGSTHLASKGYRRGKRRLECLDCGATGYEEKFVLQ